MKLKKLVVLAIFAIFSCCETNNDLNTPITENELIGTWNVTEQTLDATISYTDNGQTETATIDSFSKDINLTLLFTDNPKKAIAEGDYTLVSTVTVGGQTQTDEEYVEVVSIPSENPTWSLNGNNILLSNDFSLPQNMMIESYDGSKLVLKAEINETETENGQSIAIKTIMLIVLEK
jgi:hypothetical protein